jgi:ferredoxin--NADP+ reductase
MEAIVGAGITEIVMLGRRGPAQASFTPPELQELGELADADVVVDPAELELDPASAAALEADRATARRNYDLLREYAARTPEGKSRTLKLRFCVSPVAILGEGRVEAVEVVRNELVAGADGQIRAVPTDEVEVIPCGIVLRSVGYRGVALPGLPFHEARGVIPNEGGRVIGDDGGHATGEYAVGWIKRGPSGVIGTNKKDAADTVAKIVADAGAYNTPSQPDGDAIDEWIAERAPDVVTWEGWQSIDAREREQGEPHGRPRIKLVRVADLIAAGRGTPAR